MRKGTTPKLKIKTSLLKDDFDVVIISIKQGSILINKKKEEITQEQGYLTAKLTQEETLKLNDSYVAIQIRAKKGDNAYASNIVTLPVKDILYEEVI